MAPKSRLVPDAKEAVALMQLAPSRGRGRRSPVMIWMMQNRETLAAGFAQTAPAWNVLATYLGERGVTDGDGKPPTARTAREAWARVLATTKPTVSTASNSRPAIVQCPEPDASPAPASAAPHEDGSAWRQASLRNHTPSVPQPPAPPRPQPAKRDADAEIARLLGSRPVRGFSTPENED